MKSVLSGNEAIARAFWEAGGKVAVAYPGTPSTEIIENCSKYKELDSQWSINEKVAMEVAAGSCIGGARTICAMKHVGLNVAADPFFTLSYTGVNAGLVVVTADDPQMHSSQNEQDNRHYGRAAKVLMLEPASSQEAYDYVKAGLELSEKYDTPVLLRVTTRICHAHGVVNVAERQEVELKPYEKQYQKFVMLPAHARMRHPIVEKRLDDLREFGRNCPFNRVEDGKDRSIGFITSGISYTYVKEAFPDAPVLKYGLTFPLNTDIARDFAATVDKLYVVEEGDPYLEDQLKAVGIKVDHGKDVIGLIGELSVDRVRRSFCLPVEDGLSTEVPVPGRPPALCAGCSHRGIFTALKKEKATVFGDIGCYTLAALPPISTMDACICMGASVSGASGLVKARKHSGEKRRMACVIGDSTFMHSGITGLIDAVYNRNPFVTVILDNRVTAMTGHQNNPVTGLDIHNQEAWQIDLMALCKACGVKHVDIVDAYNMEEMRSVLQKHWELDEPSVVITKRVCVAWARWTDVPYTVDTDLCTGCMSCVRIGCPAIVFDKENRKSSISDVFCVGCSLCAQECKFNAIYRTDKEEEHLQIKEKELKERAEKKARKGGQE